MQLKLSYYIAINVCSRKSATTFGDLPDCLTAVPLFLQRTTLAHKVMNDEVRTH